MLCIVVREDCKLCVPVFRDEMASFPDLCSKLCAIPAIETDYDRSNVNSLLDNLILLVVSSDGSDKVGSQPKAATTLV